MTDTISFGRKVFNILLTAHREGQLSSVPKLTGHDSRDNAEIEFVDPDDYLSKLFLRVGDDRGLFLHSIERDGVVEAETVLGNFAQEDLFPTPDWLISRVNYLLANAPDAPAAPAAPDVERVFENDSLSRWMTMDVLGDATDADLLVRALKPFHGRKVRVQITTIDADPSPF